MESPKQTPISYNSDVDDEERRQLDIERLWRKYSTLKKRTKRKRRELKLHLLVSASKLHEADS